MTTKSKGQQVHPNGRDMRNNGAYVLAELRVYPVKRGNHEPRNPGAWELGFGLEPPYRAIFHGTFRQCQEAAVRVRQAIRKSQSSFPLMGLEDFCRQQLPPYGPPVLDSNDKVRLKEQASI